MQTSILDSPKTIRLSPNRGGDEVQARLSIRFLATVWMAAGLLPYSLATEPDRAAISAAYEGLLIRFPEDRPGFGLDSYQSAVEHQPMTYGLYLSAEALRARSEQTRGAGPKFTAARDHVRTAAIWLVDNQDLDGDGKPGWGLPESWDAWADGTVNPENQPYTITTAIVLTGLLDALQVKDAFTDKEHGEIAALTRTVVLRWCNEVWSNGYGGGYFWYSPSKADDIFGVNAPAMFLTPLVRLLKEHPELLSEEETALIRARTDALAKAVVSTAVLREGRPFWKYAPIPNRLKHDKPNDLVHHAYVLFGVERYRDWSEGAVQIPWSRNAAAASLDHFLVETGETSENRILELADFDAPHGPGARLWGAGTMLGFYGLAGKDSKAERVFRSIDANYGPFPNLRWVPSDSTRPNKDASYLRHDAHVLYGLALVLFQ